MQILNLKKMILLNQHNKICQNQLIKILKNQSLLLEKLKKISYTFQKKLIIILITNYYNNMNKNINGFLKLI